MRRVHAREPLAHARGEEEARPEGVVGLVLLLAVTGSALAVFVGPPEPARFPPVPSWRTLEVLAGSPNPPLDGALAFAVLAAWSVWAWTAFSVVIELALALAEHGPARGASWLLGARTIADRLTLPVARKAVAAAFVVQLATRPALPALAYAVEPQSMMVTPVHTEPQFFAPIAPRFAEPPPASAVSDEVVQYTVQRGDTLWAIAERYYGTGEEFERIIDANAGKQMQDGRVFDRAGLIYPGWTLDLPLPSPLIDDRDGTRWYVVQRGDTLSSVSARLLGDEMRYQELFELNAGARLGDSGPSLSSPNLIWPGLRLRLPGDDALSPASSEQDTQPASVPLTSTATPAPTGPPSPTVLATPVTATPTPVLETGIGASSVSTAVVPTAAATEAPTAEATVPTSSTQDGPHVPVADVMAIAVAAGMAGLAGLGLAGARVLRRRRGVERHDEPPIALEQGFALSDPARVLGQRLSGETDAATEIASRLAQSYFTLLTASLSEPEAAEVLGRVELVAVRHGQSSTTCVLSAPPVARDHLLRHLESAVVGAFGEAVDIEGIVSHDGDLFVQVAGIDPRRVRVAVIDHASCERLWREPLLVPLGLLYDRQTLYANWHSLRHVVIAAPLGQAAETVLAGLLASLIARRSPADLAVVTVAGPHTLPRELMAAPHQLVPPVDPADNEGLRSLLGQLHEELERRAMAPAGELVEVAVVIRELADLPRELATLLVPLLGEGPAYGIHVLAASDRAAGDLADAGRLLDDFRTRIVLQTADEDASQTLLGAAGAEELGPGGNMLVRLEGRTPVRAHAFRVAPDHLSRLVALMQQQPSPVPSGVSDVDMDGAEPVAGSAEAHVSIAADVSEEETGDEEKAPGPEYVVSLDGAAATGDIEQAERGGGPQTNVAKSADNAMDNAMDTAPAEAPTARPRSDLLRQMDRAPLRVRCFGTRGVWHGERQIWPSTEAVEDTGWELVVLLGIYPVAGVQAEMLADTIWDEDTPPDPGSVLRKRRRRLRQELKRLIPQEDLDPLPTDSKGRVYRLDPTVIASDVHQFVELAGWAKSLSRADAIVAYEEALTLYRGDLLDSVAVPTYTWLYDGAAIATSLRPDYRRLQEEVRLRLADLYAAGSSEEELGRAIDLYTELTAERPDDDRRWMSLFRAHGRCGDAMGLDLSVRRLRTALVELGQGEKPNAVRLSPNIQRVLEEVQSQLSAPEQSAVG